MLFNVASSILMVMRATLSLDGHVYINMTDICRCMMSSVRMISVICHICAIKTLTQQLYPTYWYYIHWLVWARGLLMKHWCAWAWHLPPVTSYLGNMTMTLENPWQLPCPTHLCCISQFEYVGNRERVGMVEHAIFPFDLWSWRYDLDHGQFVTPVVSNIVQFDYMDYSQGVSLAKHVILLLWLWPWSFHPELVSLETNMFACYSWIHSQWECGRGVGGECG